MLFLRLYFCFRMKKLHFLTTALLLIFCMQLLSCDPVTSHTILNDTDVAYNALTEPGDSIYHLEPGSCLNLGQTIGKFDQRNIKYNALIIMNAQHDTVFRFESRDELAYYLYREVKGNFMFGYTDDLPIRKLLRKQSDFK